MSKITALKIAEFAHEVIQDRAENLLDYGVLKSPIDTSRSLVSIVDGQLIKLNKKNRPIIEAVKESLKMIPHGKYALIFIDDKDVFESFSDEIKDIFHPRKEPQIFTGAESTSNLKTWLCEPQKRQFDMCIVGTQHQCNGIETDIVVHIYPDDCPWCGISNADPVIISRTLALLIVSTYQRVKCDCGWKARKEEVDHGWRTPQIHSDNEDEGHEEHQYLIDPENPQDESVSCLKWKCKLVFGIVGAILILSLISFVGYFGTRSDCKGKRQNTDTLLAIFQVFQSIRKLQNVSMNYIHFLL